MGSLRSLRHTAKVWPIRDTPISFFYRPVFPGPPIMPWCLGRDMESETVEGYAFIWKQAGLFMSFNLGHHPNGVVHDFRVTTDLDPWPTNTSRRFSRYVIVTPHIGSESEIRRYAKDTYRLIPYTGIFAIRDVHSDFPDCWINDNDRTPLVGLREPRIG